MHFGRAAILVGFAGGFVANLGLAGLSLSAELLVGRCHMNHCWWFSIEDRNLIASNERGALFQATVKEWESEHPDGNYKNGARRTGGDASTNWFFCSKQMPAVIWRSEGNLEGVVIDPYNVAGATEGVTAMYFAACHGVHYTEEVSLSERFGYPNKGDDSNLGSDQFTISRPEDILVYDRAKDRE